MTVAICLVEYLLFAGYMICKVTHFLSKSKMCPDFSFRLLENSGPEAARASGGRLFVTPKSIFSHPHLRTSGKLRNFALSLKEYIIKVEAATADVPRPTPTPSTREN